jgi:hypothetical protein
MLKQKRAERNDAKQRVELVPEERAALAGAQWLDTASDGMRGRLLSCCHGNLGS